MDRSSRLNPMAVPSIVVPWMIPKEGVRSSGRTRAAT